MSNPHLPGNDYVAVAKFRIEGVHDQQSEDGQTDATMIAAALNSLALGMKRAIQAEQNDFTLGAPSD